MKRRRERHHQVVVRCWVREVLENNQLLQENQRERNQQSDYHYFEYFSIKKS